MRVLVVTGRLALPRLETLSERFPPDHEFVIQAVPVEVAALITTQHLRQLFRELPLTRFDLVLLPGLVPWDATPLEKEYAVPIRKGPKNASDLPRVLAAVDLPTLSGKQAADTLLQANDEAEWDEVIADRLQDPALFEGFANFLLQSGPEKIPVGRAFPPVVVAQVVNAPDYNLAKITEFAEYYLETGARVIDVGATTKHARPEALGEVVRHLKQTFDVPVAIDSMRDEEILAGVEAGADLVLSIDHGNLHLLDQIPPSVALVVIPTNQRAGRFPRAVPERARALHAVVAVALDHGFTRVLADPLLETPIQPGLLPSLASIHAFEQLNEWPVPLFVGVENVVEMCDFDSPGMNGLLAALAVEARAGGVLTTEYSPKTRHAVRELERVLRLAFWARVKQAPPKDFQLAGFVAKSKHSGDPIPPYPTSLEIPADVDETYIPDPAGYFKFFVHHGHTQIVACHYTPSHVLDRVVTGSSAEMLGKEIFKSDLVGNFQHALYVGRELQEAERCLHTGATYLQDRSPPDQLRKSPPFKAKPQK